jgi:hypothetical protein
MNQAPTDKSDLITNAGLMNQAPTLDNLNFLKCLIKVKSWCRDKWAYGFRRN